MSWFRKQTQTQTQTPAQEVEISQTQTKNSSVITCLNYKTEEQNFLQRLFPSANPNSESLKNKYSFMIRFYLLKGLCRDTFMRPNRRIALIETNGKKYIRFFDRNYIITKGRTGNNRASYVDLLREDVDKIVEMTPFLSFNLAKILKTKLQQENQENQENINKKIIIFQTSIENVPQMSLFSDIAYLKTYTSFIKTLTGYLVILALIIVMVCVTIKTFGAPLAVGALGIRGTSSSSNSSSKPIQIPTKQVTVKLDELMKKTFNVYNNILCFLYNKKYQLFMNEIITESYKNKFEKLYNVSFPDTIDDFFSSSFMEFGAMNQQILDLYFKDINCDDSQDKKEQCNMLKQEFNTIFREYSEIFSRGTAIGFESFSKKMLKWFEKVNRLKEVQGGFRGGKSHKKKTKKPIKKSTKKTFKK